MYIASCRLPRTSTGLSVDEIESFAVPANIPRITRRQSGIFRSMTWSQTSFQRFSMFIGLWSQTKHMCYSIYAVMKNENHVRFAKSTTTLLGQHTQRDHNTQRFVLDTGLPVAHSCCCEAFPDVLYSLFQTHGACSWLYRQLLVQWTAWCGGGGVWYRCCCYSSRSRRFDVTLCAVGYRSSAVRSFCLYSD